MLDGLLASLIIVLDHEYTHIQHNRSVSLRNHQICDLAQMGVRICASQS